MRILSLLLASLAVLMVTVTPTFASDCYFECVYYHQIGEYSFDYQSTPNCCYVLPGGGTGMNAGVPCSGQHSPERTCYALGFWWEDGEGCVCHGVGEIERCSSDMIVWRTHVTFACAVDANGIPVCSPTHGTTEPFTTTIPVECLIK